MNPFRDNPEILPLSSAFYRKFYNDSQPRKIILGINPGRLGAGATGIPFTDTKRLQEICGIHAGSLTTHEPSSVFVYDVIEKYGGITRFYNQFYINSLCPLGFVTLNKKGNWVNCNYYDYKELAEIMKPFIVKTLLQQMDFGIDTKTCFVLGRKNAEYVRKINDELKLFGEIVTFDHPRFIVQYKSKQKDEFILDYLKRLK